MRGALRVRAHRCPTCDAPARGSEARWCGTCGDPLDPGGEAARAERSAPTSRRWSPGLLRAIALVGAAGAVVGLLAAGGTVVERATSEPSSAVRDVSVAAPDGAAVSRLERQPPAPVADRTEPACVRGGTDDCFLWTLTTARGAVSAGHHHVVDDLLLASEGPELVARELATGEERWRTDELGPLTPYAATPVDGLLVIAGEDRRGASIQAATAVAAGVDPGSGEVRWREGALRVSLAAGGTTVLVTGEGRLRALGPDGSLRWEADERIESRLGSTAWAEGHLVAVHDGAGEVRYLRASDGRPIDLQGSPVVSDETATFVWLHDGAGGDGFGYALVDADGEVWRIEGPPRLLCFHDVRLGETAVELTSCAGDRFDLLREDGSAVDVTDDASGTSAAPGTPTSPATPAAPGTLRAGAYELRYRDRRATGEGEDLLVLDAASGREVAILPPATWVVQPHAVGAPDDVVVLAAPDRLIALPPAVRRWNGRSSGTSELRSLFAPTTLSVRPR